MEFEKAYKKIKEADHIVLAAHQNPDGDALGSSLGMYSVLKNMGKRVSVYNITKPLPKYLDFLPNYNKITDKLPKGYDLMISLDCASFDRLGVDKKPPFLINIDHHISNTMYGDINIVNPNAAATAQIVFDFLKYSKIPIDLDAAISLYTGVVTDTGSFQYSSVDKKVFEMAGELVGLGADPAYVAKMLFQRDSLSRLRLLSKAYDTIEMCCERAAFVEITKEMLEITGATRDDTDTIVNSVRNIEPVEIACMLREDDDGIKVSLRSKNYADVSKIAVKYGGGGHIRAAGATIKGEFDFEKVKNMLKSDIQEALKGS